jgi:hypothetical protein
MDVGEGCGGCPTAARADNVCLAALSVAPLAAAPRETKVPAPDAINPQVAGLDIMNRLARRGIDTSVHHAPDGSYVDILVLRTPESEAAADRHPPVRGNEFARIRWLSQQEAADLDRANRLLDYPEYSPDGVESMPDDEGFDWPPAEDDF